MILIISCKKNIIKSGGAVVLSQQRSFKEVNINHVVCYGDSEFIRRENHQKYFYYDAENNYLILDCDDGYDGLSEKVFKGIKAVNEMFSPDFIVKMDDDVVPNCELLKGFLNSEFPHSDYEGNKIIVDEPYWSSYGINKFSKPENKTETLVGPVIFCSGPVYFLSEKAYKILIHYMGEYVYKIKFEDVCVGTVLNKHFIYPKNVNLYSNDFSLFRSSKFICWHSCA